MNTYHKFVLIPSIIFILSPFLIAATGFIDMGLAGGLIFYTLIIGLAVDLIAHSVMKKRKTEAKEAI